jgi:hypothetical protein
VLGASAKCLPQTDLACTSPLLLDAREVHRHHHAVAVRVELEVADLRLAAVDPEVDHTVTADLAVHAVDRRPRGSGSRLSTLKSVATRIGTMRGVAVVPGEVRRSGRIAQAAGPTPSFIGSPVGSSGKPGASDDLLRPSVRTADGAWCACPDRAADDRSSGRAYPREARPRSPGCASLRAGSPRACSRGAGTRPAEEKQPECIQRQLRDVDVLVIAPVPMSVPPCLGQSRHVGKSGGRRAHSRSCRGRRTRGPRAINAANSSRISMW